MLKTRILTALVLVPAVLAALFLMPPLVWALTTLALIGIAAYEWARLTGFTAPRWAAVVGGALVIGLVLLFSPLAGFGRGWPNAVVPAVCGVAALFWVFVAPPWVIARWPTQRPLPMLLLGWIVLAGAWVALVELQARSPWLVLAAMAIVWIADTAAYFSGRAVRAPQAGAAREPGQDVGGRVRRVDRRGAVRARARALRGGVRFPPAGVGCRHRRVGGLRRACSRRCR